ncbi:MULTISPECIES: hypothetical protein [unclassified Agarivorans]|uniref:hypothetical protein n=1 Tax=unclassified Agarivorans TaxID=2636026 RepID=UPI003D7CDCF7
MSKDPRHIDKRLPLVMVLFIGVFCYYTWSPDSPFQTSQLPRLEQALSQTFQGLSRGNIRLLASRKTSPSHYNLKAITTDGSALELQILANLPQPPAIGSLWRVSGKLQWQGDIAILDTLVAKGSMTKRH